MSEKKTTTSMLDLSSSQAPATSGKQVPQYAAALSATLGALAFGTVMGWTGAAGDEGVNLSAEYDIPISISEFSWIGSISNLGCAVICIPMGILMDSLGRKLSMLVLVLPFTIGWLLVINSKSVVMFCAGRFLLGLSGGGFCVGIPVYTAEIGEVSVRGRLGSYLDLTMSTGILLSFIVGSFVTIRQLSMILATIPLLFFAAFSFMPESPVYYLIKNKGDMARKSLLILRGPDYDVDKELRMARTASLKAATNRGSFLKAIRTKAARKGLIIAYGLMFFQQMSGITAIIFYTPSIFGNEGSLSPSASMIIAGSLQVFSTWMGTLLVDKLGRRVLLISSILAMTIGTFLLGVYFYLAETGRDVSSISWLPLASVCLFLVMSSFGFGPIPWMMIGELFPPQIKGVAGSSACCFNWAMAFLVARWYNDFANAYGIHATFWIFSVTCALGTVFVVFVVPETKGKSLEQIQVDLDGKLEPLDSVRK